MFKKLFQWLIIIITVIFLIKNVQLVIETIVSFNLDLAVGNFFGVYILFLVEIFILLIIYDVLMFELYLLISFVIEKLGRLLIRKKNIGLALLMIRVDYNTVRVFKFLRLGWVQYGDSRQSTVWIGISKSTLFQKIFTFIGIVISLPAILALVFSLLTLNITNVGWIYSQWEYFFEFLKKVSTIKINFGDIFSKLPAIVALLTIIPVFFFFYFYSQKREVRKIMDRKNLESLEVVVIKHNELSKLISRSIYDISENIDYVIDCQQLIVELILNKMIRNIYELEGRDYYRNKSVETYLFKEIPEIQKIAELVTELTSNELDYFTIQFSMKRYEIHYFYRNFYSFNSPEQLNRLFFTKQGMKEKISNVKRLNFDFSKKELRQCRKEQQEILSYRIYDALEALYALKRYNESLKRYLNSSKTEKTLMKILIKDK